MKNLITQSNLLKLSLLGFLLISGILGCGPQMIQTGESSFASRGEDIATDKAIAYCSHDVANGELAARAMLWEDGQGNYRLDWLRLKFDRFPTSFSSNNNSALQVFTRTVSSSGVVGSAKRVSFRLETKTTSFSLLPIYYRDSKNTLISISTPVVELPWYQIKGTSKEAFKTDITDASGFFGSTSLLIDLQDPNGDAKILTIALYENPGQEPTQKLDLLIPGFLANPTEYAADKPLVLQELHPLGSLTGTSADFAEEANSFCF